MADRNIGAEKPNGNCEPPSDRFVAGWPPPGIPAIAPALTLRHRPSRACRGATAALGLRTDGSLENRPQRPSEVFDLKPTSGDSGVDVKFVGWRPSRNCSTDT